MNSKRASESQTVVILFVAGAALVVAAFTFALARNWATFDPLVTASMIGVGLLLIVIYDRLGHMHSELRTISSLLERIDAHDRPDSARGPKGPSGSEGG